MEILLLPSKTNNFIIISNDDVQLVIHYSKKRTRNFIGFCFFLGGGGRIMCKYHSCGHLHIYNDFLIKWLRQFCLNSSYRKIYLTHNIGFHRDKRFSSFRGQERSYCRGTYACASTSFSQISGLLILIFFNCVLSFFLVLA